jgi:hypothetical protein
MEDYLVVRKNIGTIKLISRFAKKSYVSPPCETPVCCLSPALTQALQPIHLHMINVSKAGLSYRHGYGDGRQDKKSGKCRSSPETRHAESKGVPLRRV